MNLVDRKLDARDVDHERHRRAGSFQMRIGAYDPAGMDRAEGQGHLGDALLYGLLALRVGQEGGEPFPAPAGAIRRFEQPLSPRKRAHCPLPPPDPPSGVKDWPLSSFFTLSCIRRSMAAPAIALSVSPPASPLIRSCGSATIAARVLLTEQPKSLQAGFWSRERASVGPPAQVGICTP